MPTRIQLSQPNADLFMPDGKPFLEAIQCTTHLGIGAHQDDLEFMALHGIVSCHESAKQWFGGITCTDGGGSSRSGPYAGFTDEEIEAVRVEEQKAAAVLGNYSYMAQLGHPSAHAKDPKARGSLVDDLHQLIALSGAKVIYTHNPFDKHPTHVGVCLAVIEAIRRLSPNQRPRTVFGCEVWRGLDWLPEDIKVVHDVSGHEALSASLSAVFKSQILGGKRYDHAVEGRRLANATFYEAHAVDAATRVDCAIDLTALTDPKGPVPSTFVRSVLRRFSEGIENGLDDLV